MGQEVIQVDSFTDRPFAGNPAVVCLLDGPAEERWMQQVAAEMNLSETAFLYPIDSGYDLRWFTPSVEVDLCGHATLASAFVLYEDGHLSPDTIARFSTRSGELTACKADDGIELDFPALKSDPAPTDARVIDALGVKPLHYRVGKMAHLVEVASESEVRACRPDFNLLGQIEGGGVIVTARSDDSKYDFVSRFFAPTFGIDEDPVTGAAHCVLGPYWQARLKKSEFSAYQASARGGEVSIRMEGDRVKLTGKAVIVMRAELVV